MDSTDQVVEQSTNEQPVDGNGDKASEQSQKFTVAGQELNGQELYNKFKDLQKVYTQTSQELSETKKTNSLSDEENNALEFIRSNTDFVTKADLENMYKSQMQDSTLRDIMSSNTDLQPFENAIKELVKTTWQAPEDVIEKYGFKSKDKLAKARGQWDVKGTPGNKEKSIAEMSPTEYEKFRTKHGIWSNKWTFS